MADRTSQRSVHRALILKELREISRDGRFRVAGAAVLALLLATLAFGAREQQSVKAERAAAQATADDHFRAQDEKNPHVAAHYGTYVFKPSGVLAFVNPGVDAFVGVSLKLEAHKRNPLEGAKARDGTALSRFSRLSVAQVIELLVPLLLIGIGFGVWTSERERGTLRQLASLGVAPRALLLGKLLGLLGAMALLLVPAGLLGTAIVALLADLGGPGTLPRGLALLAGYAVYILAWVLLTLLVSAHASSSRAALVTLLGLWVVGGLVVPRLAADAAVAAARAPTSARVAASVRESLTRGLPGGPDREARVSELTEKLLERHGFLGAETLMDASLLSGLELQAEAAFENEVIDHHFAVLARALDRQDRFLQLFGALSPVVAVRSLSMALAGTDGAHHRHFSDSAERHRRELVELLNTEFAERGGALGFDYKAGRELWAKAPVLRYEQPTLGWVLGRQWPSVALLVGWLVLAGAGALRAVRRMRVV